MPLPGSRFVSRISGLGLRCRVFLFFALLGGAIAGVMAAALWRIGNALPGVADAPGDWGILIVYGGGGIFVLLVLTAVIGLLFDINVAAPIQHLIRDMETVLHGNPDHPIDPGPGRYLDTLTSVAGEMSGRLQAGREGISQQIAQATAALEGQKRRLEETLRDLPEGVVICNLAHEILLYNRRALELLQVAGELGLGRSLFSVASRRPILHALERLTNRHREGRHVTHPRGLSTPFIATTSEGGKVLEGRVSLVLDQQNAPGGYVVTFEDRTQALAARRRRDRLMRDTTEGLRGPVANLRAAVEILATQPGGTAQAPFIAVALRESGAIGKTVDALAREYQETATGDWPMTDVSSATLVRCVVSRLAEETAIELRAGGAPQLLRGDTFSLVELLTQLLRLVSRRTGQKSFTLAALPGERAVYLDIAWTGQAIPAAALEDWLGRELADTPGKTTARTVLDRHASALWNQPGADGKACLRIPLPPPAAGPPARPGLPARPEFYDFGLFAQSARSDELGGRLLKTLTFVVFDTETTGLKPSQGDEIVSIAGVRLVNNRILTGEAFSRLIHPGRGIPLASTRIHGITDALVEGKPPARVVLPQFRKFVEGAVLVAHNAAFDMTFLKMKEAECGVVFDNPVLDTLLLSIFLHDDMSAHDLDAIAGRFGIGVQGRHTAIGDSLMTAGIFLRMIAMLAARGIHTLDQALAASDAIAARRFQRASF